MAVCSTVTVKHFHNILNFTYFLHSHIPVLKWMTLSLLTIVLNTYSKIWTMTIFHILKAASKTVHLMYVKVRKGTLVVEFRWSWCNCKDFSKKTLCNFLGRVYVLLTGKCPRRKQFVVQIWTEDFATEWCRLSHMLLLDYSNIVWNWLSVVITNHGVGVSLFSFLFLFTPLSHSKLSENKDSNIIWNKKHFIDHVMKSAPFLKKWVKFSMILSRYI
jgi:hypothetical protein